VTPLRVVKVGGRVQADPALAAAIAGAWLAAPSSLCIVHGGGDEISSLQRRLGLEPLFVGGRRATTDADLELVRMVLSGSANKRLVSALVSAGIAAVGISGEDAALLVARVAHDGALGRVGTPTKINVPLLEHLLDGGYLPVVSPLARDDAPDSTVGSLNVNGDDAAAALAVALSADELLFVADVPGVLDAGSLVPVLDAAAAAELLSRGVVSGGMAAKLEAAKSALAGGVARVRIGDLTAVRDPAAGTTLTLRPSRVPAY
jgi:acetylglutamate kinase